MFRGDFYVTGDCAHKDEDGYFWFSTRTDDVINSSGYVSAQIVLSVGNSEIKTNSWRETKGGMTMTTPIRGSRAANFGGQ